MSLVLIIVNSGKLLSVLGWYKVSDVRMLEVHRALVFYMFLEHPYEDHLGVEHCEQMIALLPHIGSAMTVVAVRVTTPDHKVVDILQQLL